MCLFSDFPVLLQLSPEASLTANPSVKARSATVTARSQNESPRIATTKSLLTGETETKTKTKTKTETETRTETRTETETKKGEAAM